MGQIQKIRRALKNAPFDALLLTSEIARRYATGFASSAGICYLSGKSAVFITDFRYIEAAQAQITDCRVEMIPAGVTYSELVNRCLQEDGLTSIGLEDGSLTYSDWVLWTGALRARTGPMGPLLDTLRLVKTLEEVDLIRKAQRIAERAFDTVRNDIRPGVTEREIAARLTYLMLHYGAENMSFDPIVVSGVNSSKPHGVPSDKLIADGDFVTMDFGCIVEGYCSDMTRTVAVGHVTDEMRTVYETVLRAQQAGIARAKAGVSGKEVDGAARRVITEAGYGEAFGHGFGHGVGLYIHELPNAGPRSESILSKGAVVTAEPGIYLPGKFGVRIEDMLHITAEGNENLTRAPKNLMVLPAR